MTTAYSNAKTSGRFVLGPLEREIRGELTLAGADTALHLHDAGEFDPGANPGRCIHGVLNDLMKVSLFRCVTTQGLGYTSRGPDTYRSATVFPHFVLSGDRHVFPDEKAITHINFSVDDATTLFYDFLAFGLVMDGAPFIEKVVEPIEKAVGSKIPTGPDATILYFAGKREIIGCDTAIGRVSINHNPRPTSWGGPNGVGLKNTIVVTIEFPKRLTVEEAIHCISAPLRYLEILAGRPQNIVFLSVRAESGQHPPTSLTVHWSLAPRRITEGREPHTHDILLDAIRRPSEFSTVLFNWLARDAERHHARMRFSNSFNGQQRYTVDRLVGAANMFDILPNSAVPPDVAIADGLENARSKSRESFRALPKSPERDSVLGALGRIGKPALKRKIGHRVEKITNEAAIWFPDLITVTDEAVNCRNYYVHGNDEPSFDYDHHFDAVTFFIDALEFVFASSELVEAGWDIRLWCGSGTMMSHPFGRFLQNYALRLGELNKLLT